MVLSLSFTHPQYLFLLLTLPFLVLFHFYALSASRARALKFANFEAIGRIRGIDFFSKNIVVLSLSCLLIVLLVFSIADTQIQREMDASVYSFVLAIDVSGSMEAADLFPNRLEAAKIAARQFVDEASPDTRIGVVSFSGNAYIEQDLTEVKATVKSAISALETSSIGGTDIYEAVVTSTNILRKEDTRAIILLSDGQLNIGNVTDAVDYANKNEIVVHTIAIGTVEGGETTYGFSQLDDNVLKGLAYNTGGVYSQATDEASLTEAFSDSMDLTFRKVRYSISRYLLFAALGVFTLLFVLINTRFRGIP